MIEKQKLGKKMYRERIIKNLTEKFSPTVLEVRDDSARHAGHVGARPEGETHFHVTIEAEAFRGKSRVEGQRMVMDALKAEIDEHVHALGLTVRAPK